MGFPILCEVVREERKNLELLRTALECLTNAFTTPSHGTAAQAQASLACAQQHKGRACTLTHDTG